MDSSDRQFEEQRLELVLAEVRKQIAGRRAAIERESQINAEAVRAAWEEEIPAASREFEDTVAMAAETERVTNYLKFRALSVGILRRLSKLASSPYFGRIDFKESSSRRPIRLYIGLSSLIQEDTGEHLVLDWRAPVSSMFYDYELGPAQYKSIRGIISGELLLKRQFRIEDGVLKLMFDSSLKIDDEILQEMLGKATGDRMRAIVNTIQKEQNRIIRNEDQKVLVVQGVAGSGKTSIALHRAAYLLYRHRETMTSENIVIFSPNQVFADYISAVLPELGEANVTQITFRDFAKDILGASQVLEDVHDQLEYLITSRGPAIPSLVRDRTDSSRLSAEAYEARLAGIRWKSSPLFIQAMRDYATYLSNTVELEPVVYRGTVIASVEELRSLLNADYSYMPLHKRLDKVRRRIFWLLQPLEQQRRKEVAKELSENLDKEFYFDSEIPSVARVKTAGEFKVIREKLEAWALRNAYDEYVRLWTDDSVFHKVFDGKELPSDFESIRKETAAHLSSNFVPYEDLAPLLLLRYFLEGFPDARVELGQDGQAVRRTPAFSKARHVILDEAQDYSAVQYQVLKHAFPEASLTILGDLNQSVHPHFAISGYDIVGEVFRDKNPGLVTLTKSYRSTRDISLFAGALLPEGETLEALDRPGPLPRLFVVGAGTSPNRRVEPSNLGAAGERIEETAAQAQSLVLQRIIEDLEALTGEGLKSIAVICKTAAESQLVYERLRHLGPQGASRKIHLVRSKDRRFVRGIVVIPSYLAKGLEFEAVLVYGADAVHYSHPDDRRLLHMVCTRALHKLYLYSQGPVSPFIAEVDPTLYETCT